MLIPPFLSVPDGNQKAVSLTHGCLQANQGASAAHGRVSLDGAQSADNSGFLAPAHDHQTPVSAPLTGGDGDAPQGAALLAGGEDDAPEWMTEDFGAAAYQPKQEEEDMDAMSRMMQMHTISSLRSDDDGPWSDAAGLAESFREHATQSEASSQLLQPGLASDSRRMFARNGHGVDGHAAAQSQALHAEQFGGIKNASQDAVLGVSQQTSVHARSLAAFNSFEQPHVGSTNVSVMVKRNIMAPAAANTNMLDNRASSASSAAAQVHSLFDFALVCVRHRGGNIYIGVVHKPSVSDSQ
jgi:hypothetical protein